MNSTFSIDSIKPFILVRWVQPCAYFLHEKRVIVSPIVTFIALASIGIVTTALLNQFNVIGFFNAPVQWSLLGIGALSTGGIFLGFLIYLRIKKYNRYPNKKASKNIEMEEGYEFLTSTSRWRARQTIYGSGNLMRTNTQYHDWYEFAEKRSDDITEIYSDTSKVIMTGRHDIIAVWKREDEVFRNTLIVSKESDESDEAQEIYRSSLSKQPCRFFFPFLKGDNELIVGDFQHHQIRAIDLDVEEDERLICNFPKNQNLSLIRCCDNVLVLGYQSGRVELIDFASGNLISSFKTKGEILDAWVEKDKERIVTFSNMPYTCMDQRRRSVTVWQF